MRIWAEITIGMILERMLPAKDDFNSDACPCWSGVALTLAEASEAPIRSAPVTLHGNKALDIFLTSYQRHLSFHPCSRQLFVDCTSKYVSTCCHNIAKELQECSSNKGKDKIRKRWVSNLFEIYSNIFYQYLAKLKVYREMQNYNWKNFCYGIHLNRVNPCHRMGKALTTRTWSLVKNCQKLFMAGNTRWRKVYESMRRSRFRCSS